ncbi:MAG TPA: hypothetical protein PKD54_09895 [Pirellulaceae bacterium]|nr:hypothetical protein [Pirellulaceae bacterium]
MNRIQIRPATGSVELKASDLQPAKPSHRPTITSNALPAKRAADHPTLFIPQYYEKHYRYPLIVWLHSHGADASQMLRVMAKLSLRNYVGVAVHGLPARFDGHLCWPESSREIALAAERVSNAIDYARSKTTIADHRIILAGQADGGTMAFRLAFAWPQVIAAAASFNGPLPVGQAPLSRWQNCRQIPLFWSHARYSADFSETEMCEQLKLLHSAGFNLTLRQYPTSDELPAKSLRDANAWIMEMIETSVS